MDRHHEATIARRACALVTVCLVMLVTARLARAQAYDAAPIATSLAIDVPCTAEAAAEVQRGASLLFFAMHDPALLAFDRAAELDPACALAGWGQAVALARLPAYDTSTATVARGRAALARAAAATNGSARDRRLIGATQALFDAGTVSAALRLKVFGDGMHGLAHAEPANVLALGSAVLADLARTTLPDDDPVRSARDRIAHAFPDPGAMPVEIAFLRLLVADDAAAETVAIATRLEAMSTPTPATAHAAVRVFYRTGRWEDAAQAGEMAARIAGGWFAPSMVTPLAWMGPVPDWAMAAMAQRGRHEAMASVVRACPAAEAEAVTSLDATLAPRVASACLRTTIRAWFADIDWQSATSVPEPPRAAEGAVPDAEATAMALLARGLHLARAAWPRGERDLVAGARVVMAELEALAAAHPAGARAIELDRLLVAMALAGAFESRDELLVYELQAGDLERMLDVSRQHLPRLAGVNRVAGELHLRLHDYREAHEHFARALARQPNDARALLGLARAAARLGDGAASRDAAQRFLATWSGADRSRREVVEALKLAK